MTAILEAGVRRTTPSQLPRLSIGFDDPQPALLAHLDRWGLLRSAADAPARWLEAIEASGLRGRGGAGFPAGRKLRSVGSAGGSAVVVANGCEGEPASAKDAQLMVSEPHLVLDGVQVAAAVAGAVEAHVMVHQGTRAAQVIRRALRERDGQDAVAVQLHEVPHRYVSSEQTALVRFIKDGIALPTFGRAPHLDGVRRRPTAVNNVETLANMALIARYGSDWFRSVGDPAEPGTLLLTVRYDETVRVGEVATGTTIGSVIGAAGGDFADSGAVLVGGYFGGWLATNEAADLPMTQTAMAEAGPGLGAGIVAAFPTDRCGLVESARVATYLAGQNSGQCGPCVNGLPAIAGAMRSLARGTARPEQRSALDRWLALVPGRGACRHPDGAVRFVQSALRVFADDVERHTAGRPCVHSRSAAWLPTPGVAAVGAMS